MIAYEIASSFLAPLLISTVSGTHLRGESERKKFMSGAIPRSLLLVAVAVLGMGLAADVKAGEWRASKEFLELNDRIQVMQSTVNLSIEEKQSRIDALEALGEEIEQTWRDKDTEGYARLMLHLCGTLGSIDVTDSRRHYLARHFAMRALEKADDIPLDVECDLVCYAQNQTDAKGKPLAGEKGMKLRRKQVSLWLRAWQRINKTIDDHWNPDDPNYTGFGNVAPPAATGLSAGVDPRAIKDPKLRAEYEAAIEANRKKIANSTLQWQARKLRVHWTRDAERFIIGTYMEAPNAAEELQPLLDKYLEDAAIRARIINAIRSHKMPEDLTRIPRTTQPAP